MLVECFEIATVTDQLYGPHTSCRSCSVVQLSRMDVYKTAGYTEAQLQEVRHAIRQQVKQHGVLQAVQQLVSDLQLTSGNDTCVRPDQALEVLEQRGFVDKLARTVTVPPQSLANAAASSLLNTPASTLTRSSAKDGQPYLHVKLLGARALVDYVARVPQPEEQLQLCVELMGHRITSDWTPACAEPSFKGELLLPLPPAATSGAGRDTLSSKTAADAAQSSVQNALALLALRHPLHIVLVSSAPHDPPSADHTQTPGTAAATGFGPWPDLSHSSSPCHIVAAGAGDWRVALLRRRPVTVSVQLSSGPGIGLGMTPGSAPAGLVTLQLSLHPGPAPVDEPSLQVQQRTEAARDTERAALFLARAKAWWASYAGKAPEFRTRPVKVMARGEDCAYYPSCSYVRPLQLGRALHSPLEAARFVSLLRLRDNVTAQPSSGLDGTPASSSSVEAWSCLHTILSSRSGSSQEMALLLCSLLLGFGLDAYMCVGRRRNGAGCMWVMTRAAFAEPTLWDPTTGARYSQLHQALCPYLSVGCVFNHCSLYANCQADEGVLSCSYLLEEPQLWQELSVTASEVPGPGWSSIDLSLPLPPEACYRLEQQVELQVKAALVAARPAVLAEAARTQQQAVDALTAGGLPEEQRQLVWDASLEYLLMPILVAYEQEAITGEVAAGSEDCSAAIKRATPLGWVFKGVPQAHRHAHASAIAAALLSDCEARDVLAMSGKGCLGLRVKVFAYPEGLLSTWVMLAGKAPSTSLG